MEILHFLISSNTLEGRIIMVQLNNNFPREYVIVVDSPQFPTGRKNFGADYVQEIPMIALIILNC